MEKIVIFSTDAVLYSFGSKSDSEFALTWRFR